MPTVIRGSDNLDSGQVRPVLMTATPTTSGTSVTISGIPSWAKRVTILLDGVTTSGTSQPWVQLGDAGGIEVTGYINAVGTISTAANTTNASVTVVEAFPLYNGSITSGSAVYGNIMLCNISGNVWTASAGLRTSNRAVILGGSKELSAPLTQVRITTANGTDTFTAGSINVLYE